MIYSKLPTTIDEQIALLEDRGIHIVALGIGKYGEDDGEQYAWQVKSFVRTVGLGGR